MAFMIERVASLMLTTLPHWRAANADSFRFAWSGFEAINRDMAVVSDALKMGYRKGGWPECIKAFKNIRVRIGPATAPAQERP